MKEIIYVLTNEAMPGYVKIGRTSNLAQRIPQLDNTSVPLPFECVFAIEVESLDAEKLVHDAFATARVRKNREFFEIAPERVISALRLTGGTEISIDDDSALDDEAKEAVQRAKKRRDRFSFSLVDIPVGAELYFYKDDNTTCRVLSNNTVEFQGEVLSLSRSAINIVNEMGYDWVAVSGPACWCYEGETLHERRTRMESE